MTYYKEGEFVLGLHDSGYIGYSDAGDLVFESAETVAREAVKHTPHLRIVDAVEHAPEALEVVSQRYTERYISPKSARITAAEGLAALATAGLVVTSAGAGAPSVEDIYASLCTSMPNATYGATKRAAEAIHALYAGRAHEAEESISEGDYNAMHERAQKAEARIEPVADALARANAEVKHKQTVIDEDRADAKRNSDLMAETIYANGEEIVSLTAEVARLRDALDKADARDEARRHATALKNQADEANQAVVDAYARYVRARREYDAARQALTETNGEG